MFAPTSIVVVVTLLVAIMKRWVSDLGSILMINGMLFSAAYLNNAHQKLSSNYDGWTSCIQYHDRGDWCGVQPFMPFE